MHILTILASIIILILALADSFFIAALWVIHKSNKEEIEDYEKHEFQK